MLKSVSFLLPVLLLVFASVGLAQQKGKSPVIHQRIVPPAAAPRDPLGEADRLLSRGDDTGKDRQSLQILEGAAAGGANSYDLLWRLARAYYYVGDFAPKAEKLNYFQRGSAVAARAVSLQPNSVDGVFWLAANNGGQAELVGVFKALSMVRKIRAGMQTAIRLNGAYENGNAYLALGEIERELPYIAGGDRKRAISYFEQGLRVAPGNLDLKVSLAKAYQEAGRRDESQRLLNEVLMAHPTTRIQRDAQVEARRLLGK